MDDRGEYTVGYRRPPEHAKYQKGQSGGDRKPRGRPRSLDLEFKKILDERITVTRAGQTERITRRDALVLKLIALAQSGNLEAGRLVTRKLIEFEEVAARCLADSGDQRLNISIEPYDDKS